MAARATFEVLIGDKRQTITVHRSESHAQVLLRGQLLEVDVAEIAQNTFSLILQGQSYDVTVDKTEDSFRVLVNGFFFEISLIDPKKFQKYSSGLFDTTEPLAVIAPMPGKVVKLLVSEGDAVKEGQGVAVVEAMKMQNELKAPKTGRVEKINVAENQTVNAGDSLVVVQ
jgi:biotin carboxyl carrier protein